VSPSAGRALSQCWTLLPVPTQCCSQCRTQCCSRCPVECWQWRTSSSPSVAPALALAPPRASQLWPCLAPLGSSPSAAPSAGPAPRLSPALARALPLVLHPAPRRQARPVWPCSLLQQVFNGFPWAAWRRPVGKTQKTVKVPCPSRWQQICSTEGSSQSLSAS
jgi:hypothetical protein